MKDKNHNNIKNAIEKVLNEQKPKTVKKLVNRISEMIDVNEEKIYAAIKDLESRNVIHLGFPETVRELPRTKSEYFFKINYYSIEFWTVFGLSLIFIGLGFVVETGSILKLVKLVFGGGYIIILPGWVISNLFFPKIYEEIRQIERILLSLGISVGIVIFSGLILNEVWIINSIALTTTVGSFTLIILIISSIMRILIGTRKHEIILKKLSSYFKKRE